MKTDPDKSSDLTGVELVRRKVNVWVCMGGKIPGGREANFVTDGPASDHAVSNWPTPIVFSGYEIGKPILTGSRLREKPTSSPTRRAFQLYNGLRRKASFDQTAVLYAVRGLDGGLDDFWDLQSNGYMHVLEDGSNEWRLFKCTNSPPVGESRFLTYEGLPSDHYLWLTGMGARLHRAEIGPTEAMPQRQ